MHAGEETTDCRGRAHAVLMARSAERPTGLGGSRAGPHPGCTPGGLTARNLGLSTSTVGMMVSASQAQLTMRSTHRLSLGARVHLFMLPGCRSFRTAGRRGHKACVKMGPRSSGWPAVLTCHLHQGREEMQRQTERNPEERSPRVTGKESISGLSCPRTW